MINKIIELLESNNLVKENEAFELARKFNICITEIWNDDDTEIIGLAVEDNVIYFLARKKEKKL